MIIAHEYLFNCAKHHFVKVFVSDFQPYFKMVPRNTVIIDCLKIYEEERVSLYELFDKLDCIFSFASDLWTNKGKYRGFMFITCHYIDDSWHLRKRTINFIFLPSSHTGKNISQAIHNKLVLWNLDKKTFYLVLDNSSANGVCCLVVSCWLVALLPVAGLLPCSLSSLLVYYLAFRLMQPACFLLLCRVAVVA
jgi:hypothetical protein